MEIGLNAINFFIGRMGGSEGYFRNLLHHLQQVDRENGYTILCIKPNAGEFPLDNTSFRVKQYDCGRYSPGWFFRGVMRKTIGRDVLAPFINRLPLDLIHYPFTSASPAGLKFPSVLTFHDMQHEFYPEFFSRDELREREETFRRSAERAARIIAISKHAGRTLEDVYGIDPSKIDIVYHGCGPEFRVIGNEEALAGLREKYDLKRPFLFYPAASWPHKNHLRLLAALRLLKDRGGFDGELVLTGIAKKGHSGILFEIERLGLSRDVRVLGYLPNEELPSLYNLAAMLVFPSLFEGFGIPLVEAMACGCPIACSTATSIPEVVGDAGVLFDPFSPEDMAEKIRSVWSSPAKADSMRAAGLERVKLFTWENAARKTVEVYGKAL